MKLKEAIKDGLPIGTPVKFGDTVYTYIGAAVWGSDEQKYTVYRFVKGAPIIYYFGENEVISLENLEIPPVVINPLNQ